MEYDFKTKEELYNRVRPALHAKIAELKRCNYSYIKEEDIWNYLSDVKWSKSNNLALSDIVSDIIHLEIKALNKYLYEKKGVGHEEEKK